jgi:hypothetical protein
MRSNRSICQRHGDFHVQITSSRTRQQNFDNLIFLIYYVIYLEDDNPRIALSYRRYHLVRNSRHQSQQFRIGDPVDGTCLGLVRDVTRHDIRCTELAKSPPGIETDAHVSQVIPNILEGVAASSADAFVLACFSDPGIATVRTTTTALSSALPRQPISPPSASASVSASSRSASPRSTGTCVI